MSQRNKSRNLTQQSIEDSFSQTDLNVEEAVNNITRYIVIRGGQNLNFTKTELVKNVIHRAGNKFDMIMQQVKEILKNTYGYNLITSTSKGKDKTFMLCNALPYIEDPTENENELPEDSQNILLLLILSHILMSNNSVSDVSLYDYLKMLQVDVDRKHKIFGNVREYITKTLPKKQYLDVSVDSTTKVQHFSWGPRAEKEISKMEILEFVCRIYKDKQPKDWQSHFRQAQEQKFENHSDKDGPMEE